MFAIFFIARHVLFADGFVQRRQRRISSGQNVLGKR